MFSSTSLVLSEGLLFQGCQPDIDARQSLGDDIMQFAADPLALFLLRQQKLAGQQPHLFLHMPRLLQQVAVVLLAFPEGFLCRLALGNFLFQLLVGGGQVHALLAQRPVKLIQSDISLSCGAMTLLNRGDGLGKEMPRPPDHRAPSRGRITRQNQFSQRALVDPDQVQRLHACGQGLAPKPLRRLQARLWR